MECTPQEIAQLSAESWDAGFEAAINEVRRYMNTCDDPDTVFTAGDIISFLSESHRKAKEQ